MMNAKKDFQERQEGIIRPLTITMEHHDRGCADVMLITF